MHDNQQHFSQQRNDNYLFLQELRQSLMMESFQPNSDKLQEEPDLIRKLDLEYNTSQQSQVTIQDNE